MGAGFVWQTTTTVAGSSSSTGLTTTDKVTLFVAVGALVVAVASPIYSSWRARKDAKHIANVNRLTDAVFIHLPPLRQKVIDTHNRAVRGLWVTALDPVPKEGVDPLNARANLVMTDVPAAVNQHRNFVGLQLGGYVAMVDDEKLSAAFNAYRSAANAPMPFIPLTATTIDEAKKHESDALIPNWLIQEYVALAQCTADLMKADSKTKIKTDLQKPPPLYIPPNQGKAPAEAVERGEVLWSSNAETNEPAEPGEG
jgi:hypothetical protein